MPGLYANTGVDLDTILFTGSGALTTEIYDDTGLDIGLKYSAGDTGYALGFQVHDGRDIGRILGGEVAAVWRSPETDKNADSPTVVSAAWEKVNKFKSERDKWTKTGTSEALTIGQHYRRVGVIKHQQAYSAYAYHVVANQTDAEIEVSLGTPSSDDGWVRIEEIRSPNAYTKNFVVLGYGGARAKKETIKHDDGTTATIESPVYSTVTLTIKLKLGATATRTYTTKLSF